MPDVRQTDNMKHSQAASTFTNYSCANFRCCLQLLVVEFLVNLKKINEKFLTWFSLKNMKHLFKICTRLKGMTDGIGNDENDLALNNSWPNRVKLGHLSQSIWKIRKMGTFAENVSANAYYYYDVLNYTNNSVNSDWKYDDNKVYGPYSR